MGSEQALPLMDRLAAAEAEVNRLKRQIGGATCAEIGAHDWRFIGGRNAYCSGECACSVPVHECSRCGDCDYGENPDAAEIISECAATQEAPHAH